MNKLIKMFFIPALVIIWISLNAQTDDMQTRGTQDSLKKVNQTVPQDKTKAQPHQVDTMSKPNQNMQNNRTRSDSNYSKPKGTYNREKNTPIVPPDSVRH